MNPEAGAVDLLSDHRQGGQEEQADRRQPEEVLVALEPPVVVAQCEQRDGEGRDPDHDPQPLAERVVRVEAIDLRDADRGQERGHRQQVRIRLRDSHARDRVRRQVEREEEERVRERPGRDDVLARDVDAREAEAGDDSDDEEVGELAVPVAHLLWPSSQ